MSLETLAESGGIAEPRRPAAPASEIAAPHAGASLWQAFRQRYTCSRARRQREALGDWPLHETGANHEPARPCP